MKEKHPALFTRTRWDEVEMEKLAAALIQVIESTVQPEAVNLWLKPFANPRRNNHAK